MAESKNGDSVSAFFDDKSNSYVMKTVAEGLSEKEVDFEVRLVMFNDGDIDIQCSRENESRTYQLLSDAISWLQAKRTATVLSIPDGE